MYSFYEATRSKKVGRTSTNMFLQFKWDTENLANHRYKVKNAKSCIDDGAPLTFTHMFVRPKKMQLELERYSAIERNNRFLLERLATIQREGAWIDNKNVYELKSLNTWRRQQDMINLAYNNQIMIARLQDVKAKHNRSKLEDEYLLNQKNTANIRKFPANWREVQDHMKRTRADIFKKVFDSKYQTKEYRKARKIALQHWAAEREKHAAAKAEKAAQEALKAEEREKLTKEKRKEAAKERKKAMEKFLESSQKWKAAREERLKLAKEDEKKKQEMGKREKQLAQEKEIRKRQDETEKLSDWKRRQEEAREKEENERREKDKEKGIIKRQAAKERAKAKKEVQQWKKEKEQKEKEQKEEEQKKKEQEKRRKIKMMKAHLKNEGKLKIQQDAESDLADKITPKTEYELETTEETVEAQEDTEHGLVDETTREGEFEADQNEDEKNLAAKNLSDTSTGFEYKDEGEKEEESPETSSLTEIKEDEELLEGLSPKQRSDIFEDKNGVDKDLSENNERENASETSTVEEMTGENKNAEITEDESEEIFEDMSTESNTADTSEDDTDVDSSMSESINSSTKKATDSDDNDNST